MTELLNSDTRLKVSESCIKEVDEEAVSEQSDGKADSSSEPEGSAFKRPRTSDEKGNACYYTKPLNNKVI